MNTTKKYPKGTFIALGMLIFVPVGIALSIGTGNPGLIGIGPAIGLPIGLAWEEHKKKQGKIKDDVEGEGVGKLSWWTIALGVIFLLGILVMLFYF
ncbi:hypothetical protein [Robertkochia sediminum]|uniref:hypothetical protein n=1 Tax=Robertkochia sediminum TaxID=2785326 RepID=UPI001934A150|nr:hypothetical protein [Robertkochia sediminum]MBL7471266.1 hypothetical protein [Robertkochia sediminum]